MSIFDKYGIREIMDVTFTNLSTMKKDLYLDTLTTSNITNKVTTVYATGGKGDPQLMAWDGSRTAQLAITDALLSQQSMGILAGNAAVLGSTEVLQREVLVVASGAVTTTHAPVTGTVDVYAVTDSGAMGQNLTSTVTGSVVTITTTPPLANGASVIVYYQRSLSSAVTVTVSSDAFPGYYQVDGDGLGRDDATGYDMPLHVTIPKAKLQGNFTLTFAPSGNPSTLDFTMDILKSSTSSKLIDIIHWDEADQT